MYNLESEYSKSIYRKVKKMNEQKHSEHVVNFMTEDDKTNLLPRIYQFWDETNCTDSFIGTIRRLCTIALDTRDVFKEHGGFSTQKGAKHT